MLDTERLRDYAQLTYEKRQAEAIVKDRTRRLKELDEPIRNDFVENGVPSSPITVQARDVDAEALEIIRAASHSVTDEELVEALRDAGLLAESTPEYTMNLSVGSRIWARPIPTGIDDNGDPKTTDEDYARACEILRKRGFGQYVQTRFNIISLSSAVKEDVTNGAIPLGDEFFDGAIEVTEDFAISARMRKAK